MKNYIQKLEQTKAYQEKVITINVSRKYSSSSLPEADDNRHIIVMKLRGGIPTYDRTLKGGSPRLSIGQSLMNKFVFIIVQMNRRTLKFSNLYYLKDRAAEQIDVKVTLKYHVVDADIFVNKNDDSLADLESLVDNIVKNFLDDQKFNKFDIAQLQKRIKIEIEENGSIQTIDVDLGIELIQAIIRIDLSEDQLQEFSEIRQGGRKDRIQRDKTDLLLRETRVYGKTMKEVLEAVDPTLIIQAQTMDWDELLPIVSKRIEDIRSGEDEKQKIKLLEEIGADEMDIEDVRREIVDSMKARVPTYARLDELTYTQLPAPEEKKQLADSNDSE